MTRPGGSPEGMTQITDERRFARPAQTTTTVTTDAVEHAIRHTTLRALGFGGMLGIALIHLLDVIGKIKETPYLGVMYIALMVASVAVAFSLLHTGSALAWATAGLLAAATLVGFILSRTTGLPNASDDIGNWTEPLGLASLFVEGVVLSVGTAAFVLTRQAAAVR